MQRLVPYLFAFLLIGAAPPQEEQEPAQTKENVVDAETRQPDQTPDTTEEPEKKDDVVEEDTTEAIVQNKKVSHRDPFRNHRIHRAENVQVRGDVIVKKGEISGDIVVVAGSLNVEGEVD